MNSFSKFIVPAIAIVAIIAIVIFGIKHFQSDLGKENLDKIACQASGNKDCD